MNRHYVILFEIKNLQSAIALQHYAKELGSWWRYTPNAMIICTNLSPSLLHDQLFPFLNGETDRIAILELQRGGARQGWLPDDAWEWLRCHLC
jgi:hypothetical protein